MTNQNAREAKRNILSLDQSIRQYHISLENLKDNFNKTSFLAVLMQRDQIANLLRKQSITPLSIHYLSYLDNCLRETNILSKLSMNDWDSWRKALNPNPNHWWWRLDEIHTETRKRLHLFWIFLAGVLTTITIGWLVEIIERLWGSGPDWLSAIVATSSILLTSGALTKHGPELARQFLGKIPLLTPRYQDKAMFAMAAIGLIGVLNIRFFALPFLARYYNNRGVDYLHTGELTQSRQDFQRAVAINPDYAEAYYNLADAYVDIGDYAQAQALYNRALIANRTLDFAYNGLGYVLILQGEPERAIPILYAGLDIAEEDNSRIPLWTNLGRAYLEAERYKEAEKTLLKALEINPREAAANCNLAIAAKKLEYPKNSIVPYWEDCLRYAPNTPRGQELAAMAQVHLHLLERED